MRAEARIVVPYSSGRTGVIFGNYSNKANEPAINFELHANGELRLYWNNGEVDLKGSTDLRDGKEHTVAFERTRSHTQLQVDGRVDATGSAGSDVAMMKAGTWINNDWRDGGNPLRGDILELKFVGEEEFVQAYPPTLTHEIEMRKSDGYMKAEALIKIPSVLKEYGQRVGVIFGNYNAETAIQFEVIETGAIRVYWNNGEVDINGTSDLRDDKWHSVMFERKRDSLSMQVDGKLERTAQGGSDVSERTKGTWVGHDWREDGKALRGEIQSLKVTGQTIFKWNLQSNEIKSRFVDVFEASLKCPGFSENIADILLSEGLMSQEILTTAKDFNDLNTFFKYDL